jgi:hypothetical protein
VGNIPQAGEVNSEPLCAIRYIGKSLTNGDLNVMRTNGTKGSLGHAAELLPVFGCPDCIADLNLELNSAAIFAFFYFAVGKKRVWVH